MITSFHSRVSFIEKINEDQKYNTLVSTMINLAANLNLNIVAEGVEKIEQYQFLKKSNCNIIQGYYYAKPIPKHLIENWINKDRLKKLPPESKSNNNNNNSNN